MVFRGESGFERNLRNKDGNSRVPYIAVVLAGSLDAMTINGASANLKFEKKSCASHIHDDFVD